MSFRQKLLRGLISLMLLAIWPAVSLAAQPTGILISPLTYKFEIEPGASKSSEVTIKNLNTEPINYVIETENFAQVSDEGAPSFSAPDPATGLTTLADWFTFPEGREGSIPVGGERKIGFSIVIPAGAEPGGHYAAVFVKQLQKTAEGRTEIGVSSRVGTLILVTVPGDVKKGAEITSFTVPSFVWRGSVKLAMKVKNIGTVHYDSKAEAKLTSLIRKTTTVDMGTHTIIPNNSRSFEGDWGKRFPFGRYTVLASATDGDGKAITTLAVIWALPLEIIIPALILLLLIIIITKYLKHHLRFVPDSQPNSPPPESSPESKSEPKS